MKKLFLSISLIMSLAFVVNAQTDTVIWSSPTSGTLQGIPFVITNLNGTSFSSWDYTGSDFSVAPLSANQRSSEYQGESDWTITFNTPISNLRVYARWWRTDNYIFSQSFTLLSGSGFTISGDTLITSGWGNGIIEFVGPITSLSVTASQPCCSNQIMTFAAPSTTTNFGIIKNDFSENLLIYPNPTNGNFSIDLGKNYKSTTIRMTDLNGKQIHSYTYNDSQLLNLKIEEPAGIYLLIIETGNKKAVIQLGKE